MYTRRRRCESISGFSISSARLFPQFSLSFNAPFLSLHHRLNTSSNPTAAADDTRGKCGSFKILKLLLLLELWEQPELKSLPVCCRNILLSKFMHSVLGIQCSVLLCCDVRTSRINNLEIYSWNLLLCALCSLVWESFLLNLLYIIMEISHKTLLLLWKEGAEAKL